jgi:phage-related protein
MPLVRNLGGGLWEMRSSLPTGAARVIFLVGDDTLVPLHGFTKKSRKIPKKDLDLAKIRAADLRGKR